MTDFLITAFGALADGITDDAAAIQRAVDAAFAAGGGRVVVPAGHRVKAGSFDLRSRVELHVAGGAVLVSATEREAFPRPVFGSGPEADKRLWIGCKDAEDVTLSGHGVIDGQCHAFVLGGDEHIYNHTIRWRPALTCFEHIRRLTIRDLTFRNAANWTLHCTGCEDVLIERVRIDNDIRFPNADGIDPDHCRRVTIRDCEITAGDDCVVIKNTAQFAQYGPCEDILVERCRLTSASAAFKIGSESVDAFRRIIVRDCVIERSNRALAVQLRDEGCVEDLRFENIDIGTRRYAPAWWGAGEAIYLTAVPRTAATTVGSIRRVVFERIRARGENGIVLYAHTPGGIDGVNLRGVRIAVERTTAWPSGLFDVRPCPQGYLPPDSEPLGEDTPWGRPAMRAPAVVRIDHATGVTATDCSFIAPATADRPWIAGDLDRLRPG